MIKLITIDLDNTLFNKKKEITQYNRDMIKKALENNIHIVLATGRPIEGVKPILESLNIKGKNQYVICYNGAKIYNLDDYTLINSTTISKEDMLEIYEYSKKLGYFFHTFSEQGQLYTPLYNHYTDVEATLNKLQCIIKDMYTFNDEKFIKAMIVDEKEKIDKLYNKVEKYFLDKYNVVRSSNIFLEFLNKNTDKGNALLFLANYLNIDIKDTMAIGDALNDKGMICTAGIGVAMSNAFEEVLKIADYITLSCEEDGVGVAINKFCFNKK